MGCFNSKATQTKNVALTKKSRPITDVEGKSLSDDELNRVKEEMRIRQEMENAISAQLAKEKEALRAIASLMIEQRTSCESLIDELEKHQFEEIRQNIFSYQMQKNYIIAKNKKHTDKKKKWIIYNNANAVKENDMQKLGSFLLKISKRLNKNSEKEAEFTAKYKNAHSSSGILDGKENDAVVASPTQTEVEQHRKELLALNVVTIAPQTAFYITKDNLFEYDLPPGIVTIGVAALVIELYKRGGRLTPRSVHKLLRLGYKSLKGLPNTTHVTVGKEDRLTVVGDLHGQIADLLHIIDCSGLPSPTNKYVFNGDFVDRGNFGVEVMCTLLVLRIAMPDQVILNRGNHEDYAICTAYGFQAECYEKYGELFFGMFVEVFKLIPLFTIVNNEVFILHGGLFHATNVTLWDLNAIRRTEFSLEDMPEGGEGLEPIPRFRRKDFLKQLVRDALWSDPVDKIGTHFNIRGAGVQFGPDIVDMFLKANNLKFIIRSHECIRAGYDEPFSGEHRNKLCTIFSASDYGGAGNSAAFMVFRLEDREEDPLTILAKNNSLISPSSSKLIAKTALSAVDYDDDDVNDKVSDIKWIDKSNLCYNVHYYFINPSDHVHSTATSQNEYDEQGILYKNDMNTLLNRGSLRLRLPAIYEHNSHIPSLTETGNGTSVGSNSASNNTGDESKHTSVQRHNSIIGHSFSGYLGNDTIAHASTNKENADTKIILTGLSISLYELILEKKNLLHELFVSIDTQGDGMVTKSQCVSVMNEILKIPVNWYPMLQILVMEADFKVHKGKKMIDYEKFLSEFLQLSAIPTEEKKEEDPNIDALTRYLNSMRKDNNDDLKKGKSDDLVQVSRSSSASVIDTINHSKNLIQVSSLTLNNNTKLTSTNTDSIDTTKKNVITGSGGNSKTTSSADSLSVSSNNSANNTVGVTTNNKRQSIKSLDDSTSIMNKRQSIKALDDVTLLANRRQSISASNNNNSSNVNGETTSDKISFDKVDSFANILLPAPPRIRFASESAMDDNIHNSTNNSTSNKELAATVDTKDTTTDDVPIVESAATIGDDEIDNNDDGSYYNYVVTPDLLDIIYVNHKRLETVYRYFDTSHQGTFTYDQFYQGCLKINEVLHENERLTEDEIMYAMNIMDFNETGEIDINQFYELYRLSDIALNKDLDEVDDEDISVSPDRNNTTYEYNIHRISISHANKEAYLLALQAANNNNPSSPIPGERGSISLAGGGSLLPHNDSLELEIKGVPINIDELSMSTKSIKEGVSSDDVGLSIDI